MTEVLAAHTRCQSPVRSSDKLAVLLQR